MLHESVQQSWKRAQSKCSPSLCAIAPVQVLKVVTETTPWMRRFQGLSRLPAMVHLNKHIMLLTFQLHIAIGSPLVGVAVARAAALAPKG